MKLGKDQENKCILRYAREFKSKEEFGEDIDYIIDISAKAIELNTTEDGFIMPAEMFIDEALMGYYTPYDGHGYWLDKDGNQLSLIDFVICPEDAVFAAWYNK